MKVIKSVLAAAVLALASTTAGIAQRADIVIGMVLEPPHLDPTAGAAAAIKEVGYANIFEGLTRIGPSGEVLPALARSWEISEDGTVYTFTLATGVTFHDGAEFSAEDVKFSIDRAMAENSTNPQKGLYAAIQSVEVVDPATVKVTLKNPQGNFLFNMAWGEAAIVSRSSADTNMERPVGTGPFKFENWARGSAITLVKNEDYWGDDVFLDKAEFRIIPDAAAAVPALLSGDVHAFSNMPAGDALPQIEADPRFKIVIGSTEGETILSTNNKREPFDKLEVRQAIAHAINRDELVAGIFSGYGTPIGTHFAPHHPAYLDLTGTYPHDPEKAKELLAQAGFPDGFSATLKLPPPPYAREGGEIVAAQLRNVGINLEIIPVEWADWLQQVFKDKDYDLSMISHVEPMDIDIYSRGDDYYFQYDSEEFNAVFAELSVTAEEERRYELYKELQRIISRDAVNGFLVQMPKIGVWDARIEGMWENWPLSVADLTKVRWTE